MSAPGAPGPVGRPSWRRRSAVIAAALVAIGAVLRVVQYAARESLWVDEAMVALNVLGRSASALVLVPLDHNQVAPPLFLIAARGAAELLGPTEYALRLPALLCSLAALGLFPRLARRTLDAPAAVLAVGVFALAPTLITYAAEVKQYAGDLMAATLLTLLAMEVRASAYARRHVAVAALVGLGIVWLSQGSVLVLAGLGLAMTALAVLERDRRATGALAVLGAAWGMAAVASLVAARRSMTAGVYSYMQRFWSEAFMPPPWHVRTAAVWLWRRLGEVYASALGFGAFGGACVVIAAVGAVTLWRRGRRDVVLLLSAPALLALCASMLRRYPFSERLTLFLFPAFIVALAAGAWWIARLWPPRATAARLATLCALGAVPAYTLVRHPLPWLRERAAPALAWVASNRQPGDRVYVYYGMWASMNHYAPRLGFAPGEWVQGGAHRRDPRSYLRELDAFRGQGRVWVVVSHDIVAGERAAIVSYLDRIGVRRDGIVLPPTAPGRWSGAAAYLYDLSDPARLASTSAEDYPLPADGAAGTSGGDAGGSE